MERVCQMLGDYPSSRKRVYVLTGNEPFDDCMGRIRQVIDWGGEPHVQPLIKLNARIKEPWIRFDWNRQLLTDVARWANRWIWRTCAFDDYSRSFRK